jgi:phosphoenolpyruvate-protein phosphotransferase (PTS system enzyme I)
LPHQPKQHETTLKGIPAAPGIAIGPVYLFSKDHVAVQPREISIKGISAEIDRFQAALEQTRKDIRKTRSIAMKQTGDIVARIFDSHLLITEDAILIDETLERLPKEKVCVEFIVYDIMQRTYRSLKAQQGEFFSQRADDVRDVARRIISKLQGLKEDYLFDLKQPVVVVAPDLLPSDILHFNRRNVLGIATNLGGPTSHIAILTRSLEVPAVMGLKNIAELACPGQTVVVNGNSGKVVLAPTPNHLQEYQEKQKHFFAFWSRLKKLRHLPTQTNDGHPVKLMANIGLPMEAQAAKTHGSEGIGLFRTEYLFLSRGAIPSEAEQIQEYKQVIEVLHPHPVIFRTFDLGGDKLMPGWNFPKENNPFLGWRAIRVCLDSPDLLRTQFSAILQAGHQHEVKIMLPFVSDIQEVRNSKTILKEVMADLIRKGLPFNENTQLGIMVEIPSVVLMANEFARECDFFSIGTNDLVQYTLAVDRGNESVSQLYNAFHPSILRMLKTTIEAAHHSKIPVAICGEMAGDPLATLLLVGLGVDELSVAPFVLPEIKKIIRAVEFATAKEVADHAFQYTSVHDVEKFLLRTMKKHFADLPVWFNRD